MIKAIVMALLARVPFHLVGPPGVGKTATVEALASQLELHLEVQIAAIRDRTDFGGLPVPTGEGVKLLHLPWVERLVQKGGILFLDELGAAPPDVRPALLRVVLERVVGDTRLPESVLVCGASNPAEYGEGEGPEAWSLAMKTRFCHLVFEGYSPEGFADALVMGHRNPLQGLAVPSQEAIQASLGEAKALVAAFLRRHPEAHRPVPKPGQEILGWANDRTWERFAAPGLAVWLAMGQPEGWREALQVFLRGCLGPHGESFAAWIRDQNLPDPEAILRDPEGAELPSRTDLAYAVVGSVAAAVSRQPTEDRWKSALGYFKRMPQDSGILGVRQLLLAYREKEWRFAIPAWIAGYLDLVNKIQTAKGE